MRCREPADVQICFAPYRALRQAYMRTGPGFDFPVLRSRLGKKVQLKVGAGFGRMSDLNPGCKVSPRLREPIFDAKDHPWVRGYKRAGGHTGWFRLDLLEPFPTQAPIRGPAFFDFECGRGPCKPRPRKKRPCLPTTRRRRKVGRRTLHLRTHSHGTSWAHLHKGDSVRVLARSSMRGYAYVEVLHAWQQPELLGYHGWVSFIALRRP